MHAEFLTSLRIHENQPVPQSPLAPGFAALTRLVRKILRLYNVRQKMKRHKTQEHNYLSERLCNEFNDAKNVKELALAAHLYVEYFVNELIVMAVKIPGLVIDDDKLGSFGSKILLLEAMGLFDGVPHVLNNVKLIQRIRNHYAHNLLLTDEVPEPVKSRIEQLVYFEDDGEISEYDVPWSEHVDPLHAQLQVCALETTNALISLREVGAVEKAEPDAKNI